MRLEWKGRADPPEIDPPELSTVGEVGSGAEARGLLVHGDNLGAMAALAARGLRPRLVYLDPPFATGNDFGAYDDSWEGLDPYLQMLYERFVLVHRWLADDGALFVHLDWRAASYVRVMLDEVFGRANFRNEIVWAYRRWPAKAKAFQRLHDTILFFVKDLESYTWNQLYEPLSPGTIRTHGASKQRAVFDGKRRINSIDTAEVSPGSPMTDVWPMSVLNARAKERTGYPTQKPEALLRRILEATTLPGDLVADPFCGSGTTLAAAERLGRRWIGCDSSDRAIAVARARLEGQGAAFGVLSVARTERLTGVPPSWAQLGGTPDSHLVALERGPGH